jgi:hypothetical protein
MAHEAQRSGTGQKKFQANSGGAACAGRTATWLQESAISEVFPECLSRSITARTVRLRSLGKLARL